MSTVETNNPTCLGIRRQLGGALILTLGSTFILSVVGYLLVTFLRGQRAASEGEVQSIQAGALASDIVELGKYFLAYERVVFVDEPLKIDPERKTALDALMKQGIGSIDSSTHFLSNACGGYDIDAIEIGDLKVNGSKVICPLYLRNPLLDGNMVDSMLFRMWKSNNDTQVLVMDGGVVATRKGVKKTPVFKTEPNGAYTVELDLNSQVINPGAARLRLGVDQSFIDILKAFNSDIKLRYHFYTEQSGFRSISNERFVTISAIVKYGPLLKPSVATATETFIFQAPAIKDFSVFLAYPETSTGAPTKKMSEAFIFGGTETHVYGRVFFDGDIDIPISELPVFHEVVVISGDLINQSSSLGVDQKRKTMRDKFKKGLIVNFPAERLIKDGNCAGNYQVVNQTELHCKKPSDPRTDYRIKDYIQNLVNMCSKYTVNSNNGSYSYVMPDRPAPVVVETCTPSEPGKLFVSGGVTNINISGSHSFIMTPVQKVLGSAATNIYGTILGGHVSVKNGTNFYSIGHLRIGLPGIADANVLAAVTTESATILAGVGVPIMNLPLFKSSSVGR